MKISDIHFRSKGLLILVVTSISERQLNIHKYRTASKLFANTAGKVSHLKGFGVF